MIEATIRGIAVAALILAFPMKCMSQIPLEEFKGRYRMIYDSTCFAPGGDGGFDYIRKFVSEVRLADKGRDVLSRPATPIFDKNDEVTISAYTVLPSGEIYEVESSDIITREYGDDSRRIFVNFRQAEPGALLHMEWLMKSRQSNISGKRFFGRTVAVDSSTVIITAPQGWVFNFAVSPECPSLRAKSERNVLAGKPSATYSWTASALESLRIEEFSPPVERIIPALYYSLSFDAGWQDPASQTITWSRIGEIYFRRFNEFSKKNSRLNRAADSILAARIDETQRAQAAFNWVKSNFRPTSSDIALKGSLDEAVDRGRGNQAEGAAILYSLLGKLNITCAPYLAASRNMGEPLTTVPALFWFDRVLVSCFIGQVTLWGDPYYSLSELGILPFEDQDVPVIRLDEPSDEFQRSPAPDYHENGKAIHLTLDIDSTGSLRGEATEIYSGAMIPEISSYLIGLDAEERKIPWERKLAKSFPGVKLLRFIALVPDSAGEPYKIGYTFATGPIIRPFATRAYIPMDLLGRWEDLPSLSEGEREFPIEIVRPRFELERITIHVKPPFDVEYTPRNFSLNSIVGEIYSVARKSGNSVIITRGFGLKRSSLPVSSYKSLARFFNSARAEADKQIILSIGG